MVLGVAKGRIVLLSKTPRKITPKVKILGIISVRGCCASKAIFNVLHLTHRAMIYYDALARKFPTCLFI